MRLSAEEKESICRVIREIYGDLSCIYLFGSRVDDSLKGGDIDLLVIPSFSEVNEMLKVRAVSQIQLLIGLQKIDLVVSLKGVNDSRLVVREALRIGVLLSSANVLLSSQGGSDGE